ncbi:flagellar type III secretion system protein FlhB [Pseudoduganella sp. FT25W]|jgi:flagellar biosynthetic protein FlhB|uniref:Flagellar biosynthetic protein FlhB n=1 Tax=Duganella alba TaxID=2666081 RepID=A0A6L5QC46_9BURK|nr:flagellar biosynthesis protein FlhB [Duganella alba]MRX07068.1 flagellar type III secretion system protein FlhB [Duganella alba]MRX15237.1 flagellar type III secretion system protein FlhB [Duganella alba]
MADDSDAEKTEPASAKRLEQAREEGDVPRSREVATFTVLMAAGAGLWMTGDGLVRQLESALVSGLAMDQEQIFNADVLFHRIGVDVVRVMLACLPLGVAVMVVALASPLLVGGWLFSSKVFTPNFNKLNPISGLTNMISKNALVELLKAILKTVVVGFVTWMVVLKYKDAVIGLSVEPLQMGIGHMVNMLGSSFLFIVGALGLIAGIDGPYQMWHYANKLKMTRQELIQESKESDGNPQIKGKIRQLQREMAKRRMMADVPTADVIVTNPTHYAVALKYADGMRGAPKVVAKGTDEVAAKIREIGKENKVAILEAPALARALHKHTEIGDEIPEQLYAAVAEVLAYVFQLRVFNRGGGNRPQEPKKLDVPPTMDPLDPAFIPKNGKKPDLNNGASV